MMTQLTKTDEMLISKIAARAVYMCADLGINRAHIDIMMDIEAAHMDCGLRLKDFLNADDGNFVHDIGGIYQHLNRNTGQLIDCLLPRYAKHG